MLRSTLLLLLLAGPVSAQTATVATPALVQPAQLAPAAAHTAADTVQALRRLFARHRRVGTILTMGAIAADLTLAGISAANENKGQTSGGGSGYGNFVGNRPLLEFGFGGFAVIYGVVAAPVMGVGIQQLIAYGPKRKARIVAAFETTHKLPAKTRRQLRKYLR